MILRPNRPSPERVVMSKALRAALALWFAIGLAAGIVGTSLAAHLRAIPPADGCVSLPPDILDQIETGRAPGQ